MAKSYEEESVICPAVSHQRAIDMLSPPVMQPIVSDNDACVLYVQFQIFFFKKSVMFSLLFVSKITQHFDLHFRYFISFYSSLSGENLILQQYNGQRA